ncbi:MAG: glycosyltransferase family 2 protein [Pseudomonadota bacterium]
MRNRRKVAVIIPALNEAATIGEVVTRTPSWVDHIVVVDNGSHDETVARAKDAGATVVAESQRGYGAACLRGLASTPDADIYVFVDADLSDDPSGMADLVDPITDEGIDLVIGARSSAEPGALTFVQRFGNWLACCLMSAFWRCSFTDLGPFRAISAPALRRLGMRDRTWGWTVEMQVKAVRHRLVTREVPVAYRRRAAGRSKISGTIVGSVRAGSKILFVILSQVFAPRSTVR